MNSEKPPKKESELVNQDVDLIVQKLFKECSKTQ
jgi:hypothetical protein